MWKKTLNILKWGGKNVVHHGMWSGHKKELSTDTQKANYLYMSKISESIDTDTKSQIAWAVFLPRLATHAFPLLPLCSQLRNHQDLASLQVLWDHICIYFFSTFTLPKASLTSCHLQHKALAPSPVATTATFSSHSISTCHRLRGAF